MRSESLEFVKHADLVKTLFVGLRDNKGMSEEEVVKITLLTFEANFVTLDEDPALQVMFIVGSMAQLGETHHHGQLQCGDKALALKSEYVARIELLFDNMAVSSAR